MRFRALPLMGLILAFTLQGCGNSSASPAAAPDAPVVQATYPANSKTDVSYDTALSATFSDAMVPASVNTGTFKLTADGVTPVTGSVSYSGRTAVFRPAAALSPGTVYTATVTTGVKCVDGGVFANDYSWTFVTGNTLDVTPPQITFTAFGVADFLGVYGGVVLATFTEPMDPDTLNSRTFLVSGPGGAAFEGKVVIVGLSAVFAPTQPFAPNTTYKATITTEAKDLQGTHLAKDYLWTFTTPDISVLAGKSTLITSTAPADLATGIPRASSISVTFSQVMDPLSLTPDTFLLIDPDGFVVPGTVSYTGYTATFTPAFPLLPNNAYRGLIKAAATSLAGVPMDADYKWLFTTGADLVGTPPVAIFTVPLQGDTGVGLNTSILVSFDEAMDPTTLTTATFTLTAADNTPVEGLVSYAGQTAVFTPTSELSPGVTYAARISTAATDAGGTPMAHDLAWTFTTAGTASSTIPQVVFTNPADGDVGVSSFTQINIAFSEVMDPLTVNTGAILVTAPDGSPVPGTVTYLGFVVIFQPSAALLPFTTYTVTVTTDVADLEKIHLAAPYIFSFKTALPM